MLVRHRVSFGAESSESSILTIYISGWRGTVKPRPNNDGRFETAALFLRLGLPSTLIRHENGAFRKLSSNRGNLKTPAFRLKVDRKHLENGTFRK